MRRLRTLFAAAAALLSATPAATGVQVSTPPTDLSAVNAGVQANAIALANRQNDGRLLRAAIGAATSNAVINAPWTIPPSYALSTAYVVGDVVLNAGGWYMCGIAGTTPSTGSGPTTTTNGGYVQDGTGGPYWTYLGAAPITVSDAAAPTVTFGTTNPGLAANYAPVTYPDRYRTLGGYNIAYRTSLWQGLTYNPAPLASAAAPTPRGVMYSFQSDAPKLDIIVPSNSQCIRVAVDGRYLKPGCYTASADSHLLIDWSATGAGGKRVRTYDVDSGKSQSYFGGVVVGTNDQLWATPFADDVRVAWISDSYAAGAPYGPWLAGNMLPQQVGRLLGARDMWTFSTGGTGYIATNGGASNVYGDRIAEALTRSPNLWVFMGSTNDNGSTSAAITAAATSAFAAIRTGGSTAPIVVLGAAFPSSATDSARIETAVQAAVAARQAAGDTRIFYVPISNDTLPWITGSWNSTVAFSNNAAFYIGADNIHPVELGTIYLARRIASAIRSQVYTRLAL